jgi:hypothetical protein
MFYFIIQYKSQGTLKIITDIDSGMAVLFATKQMAKKYAEKNCLGVYQVFKWGR